VVLGALDQPAVLAAQAQLDQLAVLAVLAQLEALARRVLQVR
jgi:hypothetical protein